ncbi:MAG TPA: hypothetical protein VFV31_00625 [Chitinophagaceae bacterium]|nr:hypothetical protein [Chitinophagaceae bacterium]
MKLKRTNTRHIVTCKVSNEMINHVPFLKSYLPYGLKPKVKKGYKSYNFGQINSAIVEDDFIKNITTFYREYNVAKVPRFIIR